MFQSTDERPSSRTIPHLVTPDQPLLLLQGIGRRVGNARTLGSVALREKQSFQVEVCRMKSFAARGVSLNKCSAVGAFWSECDSSSVTH